MRIVVALIGAATTLIVASQTGHLTTPSNTREFQKDKEENTRVKTENAGLEQENRSLREQLTQCSSNTMITPAAATPSIPSESGGQTQTTGNFISRLDGCEKSAAGVNTILVTNTRQERVVRLYND
jgi:hypothetical protein